jgi:carbon storage regulator CsrA
MLVMRRRPGEGFQIGPEIEIEILEITPTRVKIGVKAPAALTITRNEVVRTREENLTASQPAPAELVVRLMQRLNPARNRAEEPKQ